MLFNKNLEIINETDLYILNKYVTTPLVMFDCEEIVYLNDLCRFLFENNNINYQTLISTNLFFKDEEFLNEIKKALENNLNVKLKRTYIITAKDKKINIRLDYKIVIFNSRKFVLAHLIDITEKIKAQSKVIKFSLVRGLMLDISQSILKADNINQIYQLILDSAILALEKAKIGTIFIRDNNVFKVAAHSGFSEEIANFQINVENSFLYIATNGKMDEIKNISDLMTISSYSPVKTSMGEKEYIKSTLTAPININGKLYGTLNIDSVEINAFNDDDIQYMTFMKNCIEIAISNFLLYEERSYLAQHDSLTRLYNRFYIEEKFQKCKKDALEKNLSFYMVVFDIDYLKDINDKYGHSIGDIAILKIVDELNKITKNSDFLSRIGGDEFLGLFYSDDEYSLINDIEESLSKFKNKVVIDDKHIKCSYSYGISTFGKDGITFKELFKKADDKMYKIKNVKQVKRV